VVDQLGQRGKLLTPIQVVKVTCVLDLDVGHLPIPSAKTVKGELKKYCFLSTQTHTVTVTQLAQGVRMRGGQHHLDHRSIIFRFF
jgi:hypothetical protein